MNSIEGHELGDLPIAVLYDIFRDAPSALGAVYIAHGDQATTPEESKRWWDQVLALRDTTDAADPDDRRALAAHIAQWREQAAELQAG